MATLILKPTEKCNSNCRYCDVVANRLPLTMSHDLLETVYRRIGEYLRQVPHERLEIIWHGGEPLLAGASFYRHALDCHRRYCAGEEGRLSYQVQTNLTLLNQEHIDLLKEFGIGMLGTSYDPIPGIRGFGAECDSDSYRNAFYRNLALLSENQIGWGFIYVVHRKSLEDAPRLFRELVNIKPDGGFMFNPVLIYGADRHGLAITPEQYSRFLGEIFAIWWPVRHRFPNVEPFASLVSNYTSNNISLTCVHSGDCAGSHLYVGPMGDTSQCGRAADWNILSYGSILERSLAELFADGRREALASRVEALRRNDDCGRCRFWGICHGGCPLDAAHAGEGMGAKSPWCHSLRHFLQQYFEPVTGLKFNHSFSDRT